MPIRGGAPVAQVVWQPQDTNNLAAIAIAPSIDQFGIVPILPVAMAPTLDLLQITHDVVAVGMVGLAANIETSHIVNPLAIAVSVETSLDITNSLVIVISNSFTLVYIASGTLPAGVPATVDGECWGGGGGGGAASVSGGGGGGGGGYGRNSALAVAAGDTVQVGGGGPVATAGGDSFVKLITSVKGGGGGPGGTGSATNVGTAGASGAGVGVTATHTGGLGGSSGSPATAGGAGGGGAGSNNNGGNGVLLSPGGLGGTQGGGDGGIHTSVGNISGGGGGGASATVAGAAGARGKAHVTFSL